MHNKIMRRGKRMSGLTFISLLIILILLIIRGITLFINYLAETKELKRKKKKLEEAVYKIELSDMILPSLIDKHLEIKTTLEDLDRSISSVTNSNEKVSYLKQMKRLKSEEYKLEYTINLLLTITSGEDNIGVTRLLEYERGLLDTVGCDIKGLPKKYGIKI